jgi:Rod binding domain-containing protein
MAAHILPPTMPASTTLPPAQVAKAWKAATDFEAMALGQMLQPMFDTVDSAHGAFGGGDGEQSWKPMLVDELARHITNGGGIGLAAPVFRQMLQTQEAAAAAQ